MIHNIDCLEYMKDLPDNHFDLVITDPPCGLDIHSKNASRSKLAIAKDYGQCEWDKEIPSPEYFKEMLRVSNKGSLYCVNCSDHINRVIHTSLSNIKSRIEGLYKGIKFTRGN